MMYRGFWILCRSCLFPVRLPYGFPGIFVHDLKEKTAGAVLACPACGHVRRYRRVDLKRVSFRIPDPFRLKKAVLYAVDLGCANRQCQHTVQDICGCSDHGKRGVTIGTLEALGDTYALSGTSFQTAFT